MQKLNKENSMGFFSWNVSGTNTPIMNCFTEECKTVYLLQPGGLPPIKEESYGGYGEFGGVDAYVWLAVWNTNITGVDEDKQRLIGIDLAFGGEEPNFPLKFSFDKNAVYERLPASTTASNQGWFAQEDDDDSDNLPSFITVKWTSFDVMTKAEERDIKLSEHEAREILQTIERQHDATIGITWDTIEAMLDSFINKEGS